MAPMDNVVEVHNNNNNMSYSFSELGQLFAKWPSWPHLWWASCYTRWASSLGYLALCAITCGHRVSHDWLTIVLWLLWCNRYSQNRWWRRWHIWSDCLAGL